MTPHQKRVEPLAVVAIAVLAAGTWACHSPTGPSPLPMPGDVTPPGASTVRAIRVVDGWTGAPVPHVRVRTADVDAVADGSGHLTLQVGCTEASFIAPGFLDRRVRCLAATLRLDQPVTLWPVRDEGERLATRHLVFEGGMASTDPKWTPTYFGVDLVAQPGAVAAWHEAAGILRGLVGERWPALQPPGAPQHGDDAYILSVANDVSDCDHPWYIGRVPFDRFGFCLGRAPGYFQVALRVDAARITAPDVMLRALLYASGARPHALAGLMNETAPTTQLSEFERRTLFMLAARPRIGWPDDEMCQQCL